MSKSQHEHARYVKVARTAPLVASIVAPLITLLDIPALSQRWFLYGPDAVPQPDPVPSIAMSVVSLVFCAIANFLLVVRFSVNTKKMERWVVQTPLVAFWIKTIVEVVNLSIYGQKSKKPQGYSYGEGFYCAAFSCGLSGACALLLLYHYVVQRKETWKDSLKIRIDGRHFMLSVMSFVVVIGIMALVFSKIEGWYFFDGVYFSIVSTLTVGFGDFAPTKVSTKILLFPFSILSIALLANQISMIVAWFTHQSELRKTKWRAQRLLLAREGRERSLEGSDQWGLEEEMKYLQRLQEKEQRISQTYNLVFSLVSFLIFWTMGALVFWASDDLPYGESLYFCYVFFLTIGYGTPAPTTPLAKVFFVLYSLIAVPVIASFAVQTVSAVITSVSEKRLELNRIARETRYAESKHKAHENESQHGRPSYSSSRQELKNGQGEGEFEAHARFVLEHWHNFEEDMEGLGLKSSRQEHDEDRAEEIAEEEEEQLALESASAKEERSRNAQERLAEETLELACELESQARALLIMALPRGGKAQTLLRADRNVQRRDVRSMGVTAKELGVIWDWEEQDM
ncbi:hypothetical protein BDY24DRAFT_219418 [Mrakia frigida]|uniref:Tok1p n=1 Tax=Mrakia frigida TaxID=29902 RepID=UPI003FCC04EA